MNKLVYNLLQTNYLHFTTVFAYAKREFRDVWGVKAVDPSFGRSDVNKRPLTDGWQTYM